MKNSMRAVEEIFRKAGLNAIQAGAVARVIVAGERDHCKSHGIYRIEGALRTVKAGKVKPDAVPELGGAGSFRHRAGGRKGRFCQPGFRSWRAGSGGACAEAMACCRPRHQ
ncbi:Ldh family oxidoreductase [Brucella abortus]|nr:Ldh family oxidoreductase [Brucella abortus]